MAKISLHSFLTTDNLKLPGLLYEPIMKTDSVMIYLHGNGSSSIFYDYEEMEAYGKVLTNNNSAFFPFNNRGAHWIKKLNRIVGAEKERVPYGMTYELIRECVMDIDGAINHLKRCGFKKFYLAGASTGANKIVVYDKYVKNNSVSKYILLSGGDDTGLYYDQMGKKKFNETLTRCKKEIVKDHGRRLVPKYLIGDLLISYQSLFDTINPDGDYNIFPFNEVVNQLKLSKKIPFADLKRIAKPTLVIYGENDEYCYGDVKKCVTVMKQLVGLKNNFTYEIIESADHGFTGKEQEVANIIVRWI